VWLNEYETLEDARGGIGGYVDRYHHPAQRARLPDTARGAADLGGWSTTTENRGLTCQLGRGAGQRTLLLPALLGEREEHCAQDLLAFDDANDPSLLVDDDDRLEALTFHLA